jgi:hypothetical protein
METEEEGQTQTWVAIGGLGCLILLVLVTVLGMLMWWVFTGSVPTFGLFGP